MITVSGWPLKDWQDGRVIYIPFPVIVIRKGYENDKGLIEHERTHVRQWKRHPFTHWWKYHHNRTYRLQCEAEAYAAQVRLGSLSLDAAAQYLFERYSLYITLNTARVEIAKYV